MMIYCIHDDGLDFQRLDLMIDDIIEARPNDVSEDDVLDFCQANGGMAGWWPAPETSFIAESGDESDPIPDISKWIDASLVLSPKAHRLLGALLEQWGELLPVIISSEKFYIFNCITFSEVDLSLSEKEYFEGEEVGIRKIVFDETDVAEKLIFKTRFDSCVGIYCAERFKFLVEDLGLTGIEFTVV